MYMDLGIMHSIRVKLWFYIMSHLSSVLMVLIIRLYDDDENVGGVCPQTMASKPFICLCIIEMNLTELLINVHYVHWKKICKIHNKICK